MTAVLRVNDRRPVPPSTEITAAASRRTSEAVQRMLAAFVTEIPCYAALPQEQLQTDVARVARDNLDAFFRCCRQQRLPTSTELIPARIGAVRRAEEGVPLQDLISAYTIGNRITWQLLTEQVPPERVEEVVAFTPYVHRYLQSMLQVVTGAYVDERRSIEHDEGSASHALVQRLLNGESAEPLAQRLGVTLAEAYLVVAVHFQENADEQDHEVNSEVAARRKARRVRNAVDRLPGQTASMALLSASGGVLLLPGIGPRLPGRTETLRTVAQLVAAAGAAATAVSVPAHRRLDLPAAAGQAEELLELVRILRWPRGVYTLDDLALEYQAARPGPARRRLAELLVPLGPSPDLVPTVRCWLRNERARRETAEELHVHPNTLDKRLERIAQLTGIDVHTTRGVALLQAALVAYEMEFAGPGAELGAQLQM